MKAIIIVCVVAALMLICGVAVCLCAADADEFDAWDKEKDGDDDA